METIQQIIGCTLIYAVLVRIAAVVGDMGLKRNSSNIAMLGLIFYGCAAVSLGQAIYLCFRG